MEHSTFTPKLLNELFPTERSNEFFDALYGDPNEGAYDIRLAFHGRKGKTLNFSLDLHQRSGKCLACNLTYGLPEVFSRHPVINVAGLVKKIEEHLPAGKCAKWQLGSTIPIDKQLYRIPLSIIISD